MNRTQKASKKPAKRTSRDDSFEAVARRLGCDEDKARFEKKLGKIAKAASKKVIRK
jgi:hypothetical protein